MTSKKKVITKPMTLIKARKIVGRQSDPGKFGGKAPDQKKSH